MIRTIETMIYTISSHPDKEKCYEWIRGNWHDLNQHSVDDLIQSIEELSKVIGGTCNYEISQVPHRGEHITFNDYSQEDLCKLSSEDLPLTGVCWNRELIQGLRNNDTSKVLHNLHDDTEATYSDEGLYDLCECSGYEFDEDGIFV